MACADTTVPPRQVYLVGDNLGLAVDSRTFGTAPQDAILGRVVSHLG